MFSLIYQENNIYGVLDDVTRKFHKLRKPSFDMMVESAREEEILIDGVVFTDGNSYTCKPVPFTKNFNIYNCLPYIKNKVVPSNLTADQGYSMYFRQLVSFTIMISPDEIISTIGLFAYYSLRIQPDMRHDSVLINTIIDSLAGNSSKVARALTTEPDPSDVMAKFHIEPKISKFGRNRRREGI